MAKFNLLGCASFFATNVVRILCASPRHSFKGSAAVLVPTKQVQCGVPAADNDNDTFREVPHLSMRAWPYRQERRGHGPTKKNLS